MEKILNCPKCGNFPLKYSQSLHLYFCPECLSVFEKFGDELEPVKGECECRYNKFVDCKATTRIAKECYNCGWNPKVSKERLERKKERLITDEVPINQDELSARIKSCLESRKQACEKFNKMYGVNISCEHRDDYRENDESNFNT